MAKEAKAKIKINGLLKEETGADYIALTQNPEYKKDPAYINEMTRDKD